jgi:hypothetical protein
MKEETYRRAELLRKGIEDAKQRKEALQMACRTDYDREKTASSFAIEILRMPKGFSVLKEITEELTKRYDKRILELEQQFEKL